MSSPPSTLGQYQIIREIARSNDIVYEAYDPLMNRRVAVKELMMPSGSTPQQKEDRISRFKREAQAAGTLNHPSIMTVYSFAEDAGHTFMAMEYLDGQSLRNELDARGTIPIDRSVEISIAVLSGLEHAHSKGVIHRDIKPDNVQILSNGQIKITDFGIARLTFQPNLTVDGQVFGTPSYMSPEQVVGREIDARSDIFSVGVMLYEMITGKKPFTGDSVVSTTYAIMNKDPDQPANISWPLWSVISRAVEKSPTMRWASASDMLQALQEAMDPSKGALPIIDPSMPPGYHPGSNPYAAASGPPPIASMYGGSQPASPAPYNPYSAPGPTANPYANQYTQQSPPSPLNFPYNPYQGAGGAYAPHTPGMPPPGTVPVYYPPPPRKPIFQPDQILFAKKLVIAVMLITALFALVFVVFQAISTELDRKDRSQEGRLSASQDAQAAQQDARNNRLPEAEAHYNDAISQNPNDPANFVSLGQMHLEKAKGYEADAQFDEAALLYSQVVDEFSKAANLETDSAALTNDQEQAVQAALAAGNIAVGKSTLSAEARRESLIAVDLAIPLAQNTELNQLTQVRDQLRQH